MLESTRNDWIGHLERQVLNLGPRFETFGVRFVTWSAPDEWLHRGLNTTGNPVKGVVDSLTKDGSRAAEYGNEGGYFKTFKKPLGDIRHAKDVSPQVRRVLLVAGRTMQAGQVKRVARLVARVKRWAKIDVDVYDARRIAETVVDRLFDNDRALEDLEPFLPILERARQELAASDLVPAATAGFIEDTDPIRALGEAVTATRVVTVTGISGAGKSELVAAYARSVRKDYDVTVWLQQPAFKTVADLSAADITRRDQAYNVRYLLADRACLLVLDHLDGPLDAKDIAAVCGPRSRVIITRQWGSASDGEWSVPSMGEAVRRRVLESGVGQPCPDDLFDNISHTVHSHPLSLRLLGAAAKRDGWDGIREDLAAIGELLDQDRSQKLAERLLSRWRGSLEGPLGLFLWSESPRIDRGFARAAAKPHGVRGLEDSCLLATDRADLLRLHDIVWHSLVPAGIRADAHVTQFEEALEAYVGGLALGDDSRLPLLNLAYTHQRSFERLLQERGPRDGYLFCLLHAWHGSAKELTLIPDALERSKAVAERSDVTDLAVSVPLEIVEFTYRVLKKIGTWEAAQDYLRNQLPVFEVLLKAPELSAAALRGVRHHKAKTLVNLGEREAAMEIWRELLNEPAPFPATRGLYARQLAKDPSRLGEARDLLFGILTDVQEGKRIGLSVALAAIEDLTKGGLDQFLPEATAAYGDTMTEQIIAAVSRGFGQGFITFAAIGRRWSYHEPDRFMEVFRRIPPRHPSERLSKDERASWGDILINSWRHVSPSEKLAVANLAAEFLDSVERKTVSTERQRAYALYLAGRLSEAKPVFQQLIASNPDAWVLHRYSQFLLASGQPTEALAAIDGALEKLPKGPKYRAAFLDHRFRVRKELGDPRAADDLRAAILAADNEKYRADLQALLEVHS